jgi:acetyl-CoA hydrolase
VQVLVTEHGVADLRRLDPRQRAEVIIEKCAHPDFRPELHRYLAIAKDGHEPFDPEHAFAFHRQFLKTGDMRGALPAPVDPARREATLVG